MQSRSLLWAHSLSGQLPRSLGVQDLWCRPPYPFREAQIQLPGFQSHGHHLLINHGNRIFKDSPSAGPLAISMCPVYLLAHPPHKLSQQPNEDTAASSSTEMQHTHSPVTELLIIREAEARLTKSLDPNPSFNKTSNQTTKI